MSNEAARLVMTRRLVLGAILGVVALARGAAAQDASAEAFIERVGRQTQTILQNAGLSVEQRAAALKELLDEATDLEEIARIILGRHRRQASPEQEAEYLRLFDALVMKTMAEQIGSYGGETFEVTGATPADERDTMVSTLITAPGGGPAYRVDWRVRRGGDGSYRLIDIVAEGISFAQTQRSEVNEIIGRSGIDGLLAEMRRRIEQRNLTGAPSPA